MADTITLQSSGRRLSKFTPSASMLMDRTIVVYGASGTGKTVIIKNLMNLLSDHIEQVLVISPTEAQNRSYDGYVDSPLIHSTMYLPPEGETIPPAKRKKADREEGAVRFLEAIFKRQEMAATIFSRANNPEIIESLIKKLSPDIMAQCKFRLKQVENWRDRTIAMLQQLHAVEPEKFAQQRDDVRKKGDRVINLIYKKILTMARDYLMDHARLNEDEKYTLHYLNFNPRMLLIFDDCADVLKKLSKNGIFDAIFYRGRHAMLTTIISCQDDTDMPASLRKNAFISFFTTSTVAVANFERASNSFDKDTKTFISRSASEVFVGHRKLVYIREDTERKNFYYVNFRIPPVIRFGSAALHELCDEVKNNEVSMDKKNPYFQMYKIP